MKSVQKIRALMGQTDSPSITAVIERLASLTATDENVKNALEKSIADLRILEKFQTQGWEGSPPNMGVVKDPPVDDVNGMAVVTPDPKLVMTPESPEDVDQPESQGYHVNDLPTDFGFGRQPAPGAALDMVTVPPSSTGWEPTGIGKGYSDDQPFGPDEV